MADQIRSRLSRRWDALRGRDTSPGASSAREPCAGCGEETAVGSTFYSDRHTIDHRDGRVTYLCTLCDERLRMSRPGKRLTDEELRELDANGVWAIFATLKTDARR